MEINVRKAHAYICIVDEVEDEKTRNRLNEKFIMFIHSMALTLDVYIILPVVTVGNKLEKILIMA